MNAAIQLARFPDGGFVLHKITFVSENGRFSAWFSADGKLLDAEQITLRRNAWTLDEVSRPVKKDGPIWRMLRVFGPRYVQTSAEAMR